MDMKKGAKAKGKAGKGASLDELAVVAEKAKPTLYLEDDDLIDGAEVGSKSTLTVRAKCVGMSQDEGADKSHKSQRWEVLDVNESTTDPKADLARKVQKKGW